jgi:hypothetical protein
MASFKAKDDEQDEAGCICGSDEKYIQNIGQKKLNGREQWENIDANATTVWSVRDGKEVL